jgi:hypothetical protein
MLEKTKRNDTTHRKGNRTLSYMCCDKLTESTFITWHNRDLEEYRPVRRENVEPNVKTKMVNKYTGTRHG